MGSGQPDGNRGQGSPQYSIRTTEVDRRAAELLGGQRSLVVLSISLPGTQVAIFTDSPKSELLAPPNGHFSMQDGSKGLSKVGDGRRNRKRHEEEGEADRPEHCSGGRQRACRGGRRVPRGPARRLRDHHRRGCGQCRGHHRRLDIPAPVPAHRRTAQGSDGHHASEAAPLLLRPHSIHHTGRPAGHLHDGAADLRQGGRGGQGHLRGRQDDRGRHGPYAADPAGRTGPSARPGGRPSRLAGR